MEKRWIILHWEKRLNSRPFTIILPSCDELTFNSNSILCPGSNFLSQVDLDKIFWMFWISFFGDWDLGLELFSFFCGFGICSSFLGSGVVAKLTLFTSFWWGSILKFFSRLVLLVVVESLVSLSFILDVVIICGWLLLLLLLSIISWFDSSSLFWVLYWIISELILFSFSPLIFSDSLVSFSFTILSFLPISCLSSSLIISVTFLV